VISRRTLFALLLTLLLALSIRLWALEQRDDCDRLGRAPNTTMMVESGTRTITVPCTWPFWALRQSIKVQILLLLNLVLGLVFVISVVTDWGRYRARRSRFY
jgi:heme/copper-type cytochrome/quinol oxidase subunit 3